MVFNRALFMHLLFVDEFPLSWPEDTKAEGFFLLVHLVPIKATGRLLLCQ